MRLDLTGLVGPHEVRVPFLTRDVPAGDLVKSLTERLGIPQCQPCEERQRRLNELLVFKPVRWED